MIEKLENCPDCSKELDQAEYDGQYCRACGTEPFGFQTPNDLIGLVALVEGHCRNIDSVAGQHTFEDYDDWRARHDVAIERASIALSAHGAKIRNNWQGAAFSLGRIRSTCTSGLDGALHNWLTAARKRLAKGAA